MRSDPYEPGSVTSVAEDVKAKRQLTPINYIPVASLLGTPVTLPNLYGSVLIPKQVI